MGEQRHQSHRSTSAVRKYFGSNGWQVVDVQSLPAKQAQYERYDDIGLSNHTLEFLKQEAPHGVYLHQRKAIEGFLANQNVCLTTGAASGKSLVFYSCGIEQLVRSPSSRIIAVYPLRALGSEQEERWSQALHKAGLSARVGRIDGQVQMADRPRILRDSHVLILTPDIVHAWLMRNLSGGVATDLLACLSLLVLDEVHNYTGVFGSNAAFLFRRVSHLMTLLGASPQYIAASATIASPHTHLKQLVGVDFEIIDPSVDTSPRHATTLTLVRPPDTKDLLTTVSQFLDFVAKGTDHKFIAFVDSRKQTEYVASIVSRSQVGDDEEPALSYDHLQQLDILPYRAGYEAQDRAAIQNRLSKGLLSGVVSTSALELGIDIPYLTLGVLIGVPRSATSFYQRIGRIGRHTEGEVVIINAGDIFSESIFRDPERLLQVPLSESALYLENSRIQYLHALCLARNGGEHDQVCARLDMSADTEIAGVVDWPEGFLELCRSERVGVIPPQLQSMKAQAGDDPHRTYPLRDVDVQFKVEHKRGPTKQSLGSLSYGQLMREAYPGAVYYYITRPYRVYRVSNYNKLVEVRAEKKYTTRPRAMPTLVYPNLTPGNVYTGRRYGDLVVVDCNLQVREAIMGIRERRGPNELTFDYPLDSSLGLYFDQSRFTRTYFTTGVILTHPLLTGLTTTCEFVANLLFEAFLMIIPFERRDISFANDRHRIGSSPIDEGDRFIAIYDQTYGSLRLSGRLAEEHVLKQVFDKCVELSRSQETLDTAKEAVEAIESLQASLLEQPVELLFGEEVSPAIDAQRFVKVIKPGSTGLNINKSNEVFKVEGVFFSPAIGALAYRGTPVPGKVSRSHENLTTIIPITWLVEIPGESQTGLYCYETGQIHDQSE